MMGQLSDEELIKAVQQGEQAAWPVLVERFQYRLFRAIRRLCRCEADAWDFVQDTFLVAYQKLNTLENPAAIWGWLFSIAKNEALKSYRRKRGRSFGDGEEADLESTSDDPLSAALRRERIQSVRNCVNDLPPDQRRAIELTIDHKMTLQQIANAEDIPLGTAKGRVRLGLEKLHDRLESKGYGNKQ